MKLYTSDLHFGHTSVINFDHRPFTDRDEMDECLIKLWNDRVRPDDDVYIVGDVIFRSQKTVSWYMRQLKGHKHLIIGNHDRYWLYEKGKGYDKQSIECFDEIRHEDFITDTLKVDGREEKVNIHLCHYPLAEWDKYYHGGYLIHGHIHNRTDCDSFRYLKTQDRALNAACCINNYTPCSLRELIENNRRFKDTHG